jgi:hypothetical protein
MRFHTVALLAGATAAAAGQTATLLLPGFQGRTLEAGVISKVCCAHRNTVHRIRRLAQDIQGISLIHI